MEQLVNELKKIMPFKETTEPGDVVLIAAQNPQMLLFARVGDIVRDPSRKDEWWHVTLHLLSIPMQTVVWTLRMAQLTGQETFTMGGEGRFIKAVHFQPAAFSSPDKQGEKKSSAPPGKMGLRVVK